MLRTGQNTVKEFWFQIVSTRRCTFSKLLGRLRFLNDRLNASLLGNVRNPHHGQYVKCYYYDWSTDLYSDYHHYVTIQAEWTGCNVHRRPAITTQLFHRFTRMTTTQLTICINTLIASLRHNTIEWQTETDRENWSTYGALHRFVCGRTCDNKGQSNLAKGDIW